MNQVAEHSGVIAAHLNDQLPVRVVCKPTLTGPEAISQICLEANAAADCVGVITWMHTFSPAKMWVKGLSQLASVAEAMAAADRPSSPRPSIDSHSFRLSARPTPG